MNKGYTKEEIKAVISLWKNKSTADIATELGFEKKQQVAYLATQIRKCGYKLPRKTHHGRLRGLIAEVISEL